MNELPIWTYREPVDDRDPTQQLSDAVQIHARNKAECLKAANACPRSEPSARAMFALWEQREADSLAEVARLFEEVTGLELAPFLEAMR